MDGGSSEGEKKPPEAGSGGGAGGAGEPKVKRKMKTASQLEVLERTYQVETYPSEALRAELSAQLGLTDRQLQMWFCHRRLKDRKAPSAGSGKRSKKGETSKAAATPTADETPPLLPCPVAAKDEMLGADFGNELVSGSGSGSSPYGQVDPRRGYAHRTGVAVPRISGHRRYYEPPPQSIDELQAIAFVEAQLGEPLREDGPAFGMEFDPLPPGAFGSPIATSMAPQKSAGRAYETSLYERPDIKSVKGSGRAVHEYQFLPEQPTVRNDPYQRAAQPHYYGSPSDGSGMKAPSLTSGRSYVHGYEEVPPAYGVPNHVPNLNLMSHQGKTGGTMPSVSSDYDNIARKSPCMGMGMESPYGARPITGLENTLMPSEGHVTHEEDVGRVERKRKSEEARLAKELEAQEKRMRKELEKQDILRRKREEQMRKELERLDRERRKEEERLLREKQREEERYQREQRREMERREKFLLKETIKAEKMRQKEELRREREAARQKAANDRAVARKLAKESMELIEDERLELMEIAASRKGLPSIVSLDSETLQNLDSFRDMLRVFPPKSLQLKKPFALRPWADSEENVGNLLMVWKFLITFADVLGLWPFTLDEFIQAFHDYDPRLLGEIHLALLRTIIKDIEDVARTPSSGLATNHNNAANPGGGHPQIVEGAYTWGFDICSWQHNLTPLTWPEILRQFALSAGFGPKLKKRDVEQACSRDEIEGNDSIDIVSNLRTGAAVENAVTIMRERGYSNPRRSRHRLTPGTVKFAAFHVLSVEGSRGLNILEVADRIQKSGLRDLTTSKTPEASIAAALSRDTKLFERTAPSTYCLRSPYRKDPADAEAILSAAREKVQVFKSGFVEGVEADVDGVEADDVEKDEDSESDTAEDAEVDDLGAELTTNKDVDTLYDLNKCEPEVHSSDGIGNLYDNIVDNTRNGLANVREGLSVDLEGLKELNDNGRSVEKSADLGGVCHDEVNTDHEDTDIDESYPGEPWVQGLMEGEYANLSVDERLHALVALIGVATEGNSIRGVLEERLELATALKKQMWAEAQLDKRRLKEEYLMKTPYAAFTTNKTEASMLSSAPDINCRRSPALASDEINEETMTKLQKPHYDSHNDGDVPADLSSGKNAATPSFDVGPDNLALQQSVYTTERCRAQLKSYIGHKAEEMYAYRSLPLGQDRRRNRYWQFIASASCNDPGAGRIFVELHTGGWRLIDSEEAFDALLTSLDVRGVRESHLHALLRKVEPLFRESVRKKLEINLDARNDISLKTEASGGPSNPDCDSGLDSPGSTVCASNSEMPEPSSSFQIESGRSRLEVKNAMRRYKNFEEWMWRECFYSSVLCASKYGKKRSAQLVCICDSCQDVYFFKDNHCSSCHKTFVAFNKSFSFAEHVAECEEIKISGTPHHVDHPPARIRLLRALLAQVEVCIPPEALLPIWSDNYRESWGMKLLMSSTAEDLLQVLTLLEGAIKQDFLSSNFQTTSELLASGDVAGLVNDAWNLSSVSLLPWIPHTTSAVALRLMELDSAILYTPDQKAESVKEAETRQFIKLPAKYAKDIQEDELYVPSEHPLEDGWVDPGSAPPAFASTRGGHGRGRARTRGGRSQRRVGGSRAEPSSSRSLASTRRQGPALAAGKGRSNRGKGARKQGRRSARSRQRPVKKTAGGASGGSLLEAINFDRSPPGFSGRDQWNDEESRQTEAEEVEVYAHDNSDSERSNYSEDNGQASGDEYDDMALDDYVAAYNGKPTHQAMDRNDYSEDDDREDDVGDDDDHEAGDNMDEDDVDDGGEYDQGEIDVGGFLNADSGDEGNGDDDERYRNQDYSSESASTDYSSD